MLRNNDKHKRLHSIGPKDCKWGTKEEGVASVVVTRSTIDGEQMQIAIPVFCDDTRETLDDRVGMLLSVAQDRLDDAAAAWDEASQEQTPEQRQEAFEKAAGKRK